MKESKSLDEEMLVVHKAPSKADPNKLGRPRAAMPATVSVDREQLELLKRRASSATDPAVRRELIGRIQREFGNDQAAELLRELKPDDPPAKPRGRGKSKA